MQMYLVVKPWHTFETGRGSVRDPPWGIGGENEAESIHPEPIPLREALSHPSRELKLDFVCRPDIDEINQQTAPDGDTPDRRP